MKEPWLWTEDDLLALVAQQVPESIDLDYKASAALVASGSEKDKEASRLSISKDVSAFANSAGGTLVYGILEDRKSGVPVGLDNGYDPTNVTREWIEQVINSRIQRRIDGIKINRVPLPKTAPGRVAYVVYVPQSQRAPHQASDKKFYKRFNFESVPMEEYEIRDVARRQESPDLRVLFEYFSLENPWRPGQPLPLHVGLVNDSDEPAEHALVEVWFEERLHVTGGIRCTYVEGFTEYGIRGDAAGSYMVPLTMGLYRLPWSAKDGLPAFKDVSIRVSRAPFLLDLAKSGDGAFLLKWRIRAPRVPAKEGFTLLEVGGDRIWIANILRTEAEVFSDPRLPWKPQASLGVGSPST